jgi:phage gpG-like protein
MASEPVVRGAERLARRIKTIRTRYALPPLMDEIGDLLLRRVKKRFKAELTPDYQPWAALRPATLVRKQRMGYGGKQKLERTGSLKEAIQVIKGRADGGTFFNTGAGFRIGIEDPKIARYGSIQNKGNGRIVARRFLGIGALDIRAVDSFLRRKAARLENEL